MTFYATSSGAVIAKAGTGVSSDLTGTGTTAAGITAETQMNNWIEKAQNIVSVDTRYDWIAEEVSYAVLDTTLRKAFDEAVECHAANQAVKYDMSGYITIEEAQTILDVNLADYNTAVNRLRDSKTKEMLGVN